ncbi:MAG: hypothetical protein PS018_26425 [bacterium]|nr:hypothetical protein [bacterium]
MSDEERKPADEAKPSERPAVELFDPYSRHFVSQNLTNDFLKSLEDIAPDGFYGTVH